MNSLTPIGAVLELIDLSNCHYSVVHNRLRNKVRAIKSFSIYYYGFYFILLVIFTAKYQVESMDNDMITQKSHDLLK